VWDGEEPPEDCPKCEATTARFAALDDKAADIVDRSRFTNHLLIQLFAVLEQAEVLQQSIKAELQGHVAKGKWG